MDFLFFISDVFLWVLFFGLIVWLIVLSNKISTLESSLRDAIKKLNSIGRQPVEEIKQYEGVTKAEPVVQEVVKHEDKTIEKVYQIKEPAAEVKPSINAGSKKSNVEHKKSGTLETVFLGNVFNKVGAIALIIALITFIKFLSPYIHISNAMAIAIGLCVGLGLVLGGMHLHLKEKFKNYSEVLIGTGFATMFISTFCAHYLNVFSTPATLIVAFIELLFVFVLSHNMKSVSSLVIGLIGGYMTPYLSGADSNVSFSYLIFLNIVSVIYALNNVKTKWINPVNLSITMLILLSGCLTLPASQIVYPVILWAVYIVYDLIRDRLSVIDNVTCGLNYIFLTLVTLTLFKTSVQSVGIMFGLTALVYALLAFVGKRLQHPVYKRFEHCIFLNVWFSILFTLNDFYSIATWAVVALMLSFAVKKDKLNAVKHYITVYYLSALVGLMLAKDGSTFILFEQYTPVFNSRSMIFLIPSLCMLFSLIRLKAKENVICDWLRFDLVVLTYLYLICETSNALKLVYSIKSESFTFALLMIYTIIGFVYSIGLNAMYKKSQSLIFSALSIFLGIVSVLMLIIGCFMQPAEIFPVLNLRMLAFISFIHYCAYFIRTTGLNFFKYLAVFLGFIVAGAEASLLDKIFNTGYITTLVWLLYSSAVTLGGIVKSKKFLINSGIWIFIFSIIRVFIHDLAKVDSIYRILAFLTLGVVLMVISYIYVKLKSDN